MARNTGEWLEKKFDSMRSRGDMIVSSNSMIVFKGFEGMKFLTKSFPFPVATNLGAIEVPGPNGLMFAQPAQRKVKHEGQLVMMENRLGDLKAFCEMLVSAPSWSRLQGKVYEGTDDNATDYVEFRDAIWTPDDGFERAWEDSTQLATISGAFVYHYFGRSAKASLTDGV
jgi:hypothetical protein